MSETEVPAKPATDDEKSADGAARVAQAIIAEGPAKEADASKADIDTAADEKSPASAANKTTEASKEDKEPGVAAEAGLIGALNADERVRAEAEQNARTRWSAAIGVTLLYAALLAWHVMSGAGAMGDLAAIQELQEQERRGQDGTTISVELVPDPDKNSKTTKWQDGAQQGPTPNPAPPQPQQQAALEQRLMEALQQAEEQQEQEQQQPEEEQADKVAEAEQETKEKEREEAEKAESGDPNLLDLEALVDAAAMDFQQNVKAHFEAREQARRRPQRQQQQALYSGGGMQVRGSGASGKSDEFSRSVIAALMKTRPGPFALWGRVLVSFQITQQGDLLYVRVVRSSGNKALDDAAVTAIQRARFQRPPPGLSPEARTYIIDYIFG
jgi:TonB family protein